jgi:adenosylcobinamide-GDP ribazoletransferase
MKQELSIFFTALMYYTRIPCPRWVEYQERMQHQATRYLPLVGWLVGLFAGLFFLSGSYLFGTEMGIVLSMVSSILLTGALHEDGFADVCDGFGGGWTKEKILEIMKDSRIGAYGVIGLILLLFLKFFSLQQLAFPGSLQPLVIMLIFITAHALSRFVAAAFIFSHTYARPAGSNSKTAPMAQQVAHRNLAIAALWALLPLLALVLITNRPHLLAVVVPLYLLKRYLGYYFSKWIGGYTGDCLGATQQLSELLVYLSFIVLWRFF